MAAYYTFEDLSGSAATTTKTGNPYHDLIESCNNDPTQIQQRYSDHRTNRNSQQKSKLLARDFPGVTVDSILAKLENPEQFPGYEDPRHCLVFWARPSAAVRDLIGKIQTRLTEVLPNLWTMPSRSLHMTALEITHSLTAPEIDALVYQMKPHAQEICDYTLDHRARLVKPMVSFDAQALALSWLPAEGEAYTYHHLRSHLYTLASKTGVKVASRYVIPSAHLTIARFIETGDLEDGSGKVDPSMVKRLVSKIEEINKWLEREYWAKEEKIEWNVGEDVGLEFRKGPLWYGAGGETVKLGRGY
ncbi:hypothetical protein CLAFUW4_09406 [Fulvia fulva]|uniref:RNA ligase/cyclic nucleotide phosphodiesterase n=1 Tax=Passalora fulva TaxID=5499 RepID=A0A9Q8PFG9_PASFU|nr:uncharacterized protein CLAFUR5_09504 [Fulvia fulva]KAK4613589.1 hypothetical protein CLAFUR4_09412 [Fulvia fulva]KAK4614700.1 hypothetical protein CLAFUR0_09403 [Fulvia fulva]UJO21452.1 hypothetical protein CLAFUR5_09504 [Fulvia fulva]WPV19957.1 hypothetical protein CLAFUW4_09406 [Fulvia fulva]WPV35453.1 hypothetical protein CLAFUW7_09407 [Fulvia fulva]